MKGREEYCSDIRFRKMDWGSMGLWKEEIRGAENEDQHCPFWYGRPRNGQPN